MPQLFYAVSYNMTISKYLDIVIRQRKGVYMKYTKQQRLDIGKDIHDNHLPYEEAMRKYNLAKTTVENYYRMYLNEYGLKSNKTIDYRSDLTYSELESLSKEELIDEVIKARVEAERAKKGYMVKGGGQVKEFITLKKQNSK